jgi:hypothetical protein
MAINFPNQSRSFDVTRQSVRFWGYDSAMEASFFIHVDALKRIQPTLQGDETGALSAFDANRAIIYAAASKVYGRGTKGAYELLPSDF